MDKRFWGAIAVIAVIFIGIVVVNNRNGSSSGNAALATEHYTGKNSQNVTLVEYGDYQCPVCASYYPVVKAIETKYADEIRFQFRNFPIQQLHANAVAGARAAEAADKQGKFWEMHDKLYQNQDPSGQQGWVVSSNPLDQYFTGYATDLKLNIDQFKKDYASEAINDIINADQAAGKKLGVSGTPTFFLEGKQIELKDLTDESTGRPSEQKFSQFIDKAIKEKGGTSKVDPNQPATTENTGTGATPAEPAPAAGQ